MKDRFLKSLFGALAIVVSCEDPITIADIESQKEIVVEGWLTNNPEFNVVKISKSAGFSNDYPFTPFNEPVKGAVVRAIGVNENDTIVYLEEVPGVYKTYLGANIGSSYFLNIKLPDSSVYKSATESVNSEVSIGGLEFTLDEETYFTNDPSSNYLKSTRHVFNVSANVVDPQAERNYYLWRAFGVFQYETRPIGDSPCAYCICWADQYPLVSSVNVQSDQYVDGKTFARKIATVPYDRDTDYLVRLYQFSITKEAFDYWNSVSKQQANVGTIFDPIPGKIEGNISSEDGDTEVLGFFTTAAVSSRKILIHRATEAKRAGITNPNLDPIPFGDCLQLYNGSTHIKPDDFHD